MIVLAKLQILICDKMPFVTLLTNLKTSALVADSMSKQVKVFVSQLLKLLSKVGEIHCPSAEQTRGKVQLDFGNRQTDVKGTTRAPLFQPRLSPNVAFLNLKGGPGNADKPFVWLRLEAITNFDDPEKVKTLTTQLYSFLENELKFEKVTIFDCCIKQ